MTLSSKWFKFFKGDREQKEKFEETIRHSRIALDTLTLIIEDELRDLQSPKSSDYGNSGWAFLQAHRNGRIETLNNLLKLTKLGDPE